MVEKEVQLNQKDLAYLQLVYYKETYMNYVMICLFIVAVVIGIETLWLGEFDAVHILISVFGILFPILMCMQAYFMSKRLIQSPTMQHPITFKASNESLHIKGHQFVSELLWKDAFDYSEDKRSFYVYTSAVQAYIMPKRFFNNVEINEIRNVITKNVVKQKRTGRRIFSIVMIVFWILVMVGFLFKPFAEQL